MKFYEIPIRENISIRMMPAPNSKNILEFVIEDLKKTGLDTLVCLLTSKEIIDFHLENEEKLCSKHQIKFFHYPIADFQTPTDLDAYLSLVVEIKRGLENGNNIGVHCRAGIGRPSLFVASILYLFGHDKNEIFNYIENYRNVKVPDLQSQVDWFHDLCPILDEIK